MTSARRYGSDHIVDLLTEAGIEFVAFNPGATVRGIHDSLVNRPGPGPSIVLCTHEEISVAIAHGYAKAAGRPMAVLLHDVVGLQHATMAIFNAWCDRVPVVLIGGTGPLSKVNRRPWIDWIHTAVAQSEIVRHYVKWDDQPADLASIGESFARALHTACSAPAGPVYLCFDVDLQEQPVAGALPAALGGLAAPTPPAPPAAELDRIADLFRNASLPVIVGGHVGTGDESFRALVELTEAAQAAVVDDTTGVLSFPSDHDLNATGVTGVLDAADVIIALDVDDVASAVGARVTTGAATVVHVTTGHLKLRSWAHDYQPLVPGVRLVTGTGDEAVTGVLERLRSHPVDESRTRRRQGQIAHRVRAQREAWRVAAETATAEGAVPLERLVSAVGRAVAGRRWRLANGTNEGWERRLWAFDEPRQHLGWHAGGGLGYGLGAAIGAALGSPPGTICVDVQPDGDFLFTPGALWTMAHLSLPVLVVVHNNRQYANTVQHAAEIARHRGRPVANRHRGAALDTPPVDFAGLARSFSIWATGPITDPAELDEALAAAVAEVAAGRPALVDVVTPGG